MNKEKIFGMLGLARRAGRLSMGHDVALQSLIKGKAKCLFFCSDISQRLIREIKHTLEKREIDLPVFETLFTMEEIHMATGYRAGVFTIDDENLANKIIQLINQEENVW